MLLLCVCWWKWCDVEPIMLLLLLESVELLSRLGVAIVALESGSSDQAAMQSVKLRPLPPDGTLRHLNAAAAPGQILTLLPSCPVGKRGNHVFMVQYSTYSISINYVNQLCATLYFINICFYFIIYSCSIWYFNN